MACSPGVLRTYSCALPGSVACCSRAAGTHLQVYHHAQWEGHLVELVQAARQEEGRSESVLVAIWCKWVQTGASECNT